MYLDIYVYIIIEGLSRECYLDVVHECVVDESSLWVEEATSWTQLVEEEELLLLTNLSVVALLRLILHNHDGDEFIRNTKTLRF